MAPNDIWKLYVDGKIEAALLQARQAVVNAPDEETAKELRGIIAWCHYRRKEYDQALAAIAQAGEHPRAVRCHVYILAYAAGHQNDAQLFALIGQLGQDVDACNALVIRARSKDSSLTHEQVWSLAEHYVREAQVSERSVSVANLLHNTARFYLDKARSRYDLKLALGIIDAALAHYGETTNWHHRAAANHWRSVMLERLTAIPEAFASAAAALQLWRCQCEQETDTAPFKEKLDNAVKRVQELAVALAAFALQVKRPA